MLLFENNRESLWLLAAKEVVTNTGGKNILSRFSILCKGFITNGSTADIIDFFFLL